MHLLLRRRGGGGGVVLALLLLLRVQFHLPCNALSSTQSPRRRSRLRGRGRCNRIVYRARIAGSATVTIADLTVRLRQ